MKQAQQIYSKILTKEQLQQHVHIWHLRGKKVVFTNGVFDIIHKGHLRLLSEAATFGDILIVGVNSDASVKRLKGETRPIHDEETRLLLLASLLTTDAVVLFEEDTPFELIKMIMPDVLVKGGDYTLDTIVGSKEVIDNGGEVKVIPLSQGFSTTATIKRIQGN
jgi:D-glycero-beta-D-manno-heptose 1-phosphate adenylyltransferase